MWWFVVGYLDVLHTYLRIGLGRRSAVQGCCQYVLIRPLAPVRTGCGCKEQFMICDVIGVLRNKRKSIMK